MADSEYKGPGKFWSTVGGWFVGGFLGGLVVTAMVLTLPAVAATTYAALGVGILSNVTGAVLGYRSAAEGQRQYEALSTQITTRAQIAQEHAQEHQVSPRRFTDRIQSNAVEGNYADAVLAERANATQQER